MREFTFTVEKEDEGMGIRRLLKKRLDFSSRLLARLKAEHRVFLNGEPLQGWMTPRAGDVITAVLPVETSHFPPEDIPIRPVFEDDDLLIIDKPAGYTVHPTKGHPDHTIANGLMKYMADTNQTFKIRFANRLDMDTTGLLIVAKNSHAQDEIVRQMDGNILKKYYRALVVGEPAEDRFTIDLPIGMPDPEKVGRAVMPEGQGRPSVTHVLVEERFHGFSLCRIRLETGRTHQIRVHLSHLGFPIAGDPLYGGDCPGLIGRQALHAARLEFRHPADGRPMCVSCPLPRDMADAVNRVKTGAYSLD